MKITVLTLFPEFFQGLYQYSIIGRALENKILEMECINIRDFSKNKHKKVDDYSFGGGPGMVIQAQPIYDAILSVKKSNSKVYYLSPQGKVLTQKKLLDLATEEHIILLNGHYEGIDERIVEHCVDEEISIGDYVLSGGEIPTMVLIDGITRLLPGAISTADSYLEESHMENLLDHPHYTRPRVFNDWEVPEVLLSGNHKEIDQFRKLESLKNTWKKRPDLIEKKELTQEELTLLEIIKNKEN
ncbi:MAG: tRNA (guanosine(37)-N1)-methyltransferase TrmD [Tissierellia bacterium]|nr:tRNA (guanosine(37)-N1)-methyltransferase TrmD [Tissierellia bacterium]